MTSTRYNRGRYPRKLKRPTTQEPPKEISEGHNKKKRKYSNEDLEGIMDRIKR
jgi:hypothetical protein